MHGLTELLAIVSTTPSPQMTEEGQPPPKVAVAAAAALSTKNVCKPTGNDKVHKPLLDSFKGFPDK